MYSNYFMLELGKCLKRAGEIEEATDYNAVHSGENEKKKFIKKPYVIQFKLKPEHFCMNSKASIYYDKRNTLFRDNRLSVIMYPKKGVGEVYLEISKKAKKRLGGKADHGIGNVRRFTAFPVNNSDENFLMRQQKYGATIKEDRHMVDENLLEDHLKQKNVKQPQHNGMIHYEKGKYSLVLIYTKMIEESPRSFTPAIRKLVGAADIGVKRPLVIYDNGGYGNLNPVDSSVREEKKEEVNEAADDDSGKATIMILGDNFTDKANTRIRVHEMKKDLAYKKNILNSNINVLFVQRKEVNRKRNNELKQKRKKEKEEKKKYAEQSANKRRKTAENEVNIKNPDDADSANLITLDFCLTDDDNYEEEEEEINLDKKNKAAKKKVNNKKKREKEELARKNLKEQLKLNKHGKRSKDRRM